MTGTPREIIVRALSQMRKEGESLQMGARWVMEDLAAAGYLVVHKTTKEPVTYDEPTWDGRPPNDQGMYHWLRNKDNRLLVAWYDLHEWTIFAKIKTRSEIALEYEYVAPCIPPGSK